MVIRYLTITLLLVFVAIATIVGCGEGDGGEAPQPPVASIGNGPAFVNPEGIVIGSLLVADFGLRVVVWVDPVSGDRMIISDDSTGSGPAFVQPRGIAMEADGSILVADNFLRALFRVNPVNGDRTIVSGCTQITTGGFAPFDCIGEVIGSGSLLSGPNSIVVEADGNLVVGDLALVRVDPDTGDRTFVSGCTNVTDSDFTDGCSGEVLGSGTLTSFKRNAVEADGSIVGTDFFMGVVRVNPVNGDRTIVSGCTQVEGVSGNFNCIGEVIGSGPILRGNYAIVVEADGSIVITDLPFQAVVRVDPLSGDRMIISDASTGSGPGFGGRLFGIAVEANGDLLVTDATMDALIRVNPVSGDRTTVSDANP